MGVAAALPMIMAGVGAAGSAYSTIQSGRAAYSQGMTEAMIAESQAKDTDLQALQLSERRREELRASMGAYVASRAARGLDLDSPSAMAIEKELRRQSTRDENVERYGYRARSWALRLQAKMRRKAAKTGLTASYLGAGSTIIQGAGDIASQVAAGMGAPTGGTGHSQGGSVPYAIYEGRS